MGRSHRRLALPIVPLALALDSTAQTPTALTAADYAKAERFMGYNTNPLVYHAVRPVWASDDRIWYRDVGPDSVRFMFFDPVRATKEPAFDHAKLAAALSTASAKKYAANQLPFNSIELAADGDSVSFSAGGRQFRCDRQVNQCKEEKGRTTAGGRFRNYVPSPDKKKTAKKIATFQQDQRNVGEMYLVETAVGHSVLHAWKYPLPGDETVAMIRRVIIDVDAARVIALQMPPDQHRSTLCDHIVCRVGNRPDVEMEPRLEPAGVRLHIKSGQGMANWCYLPASNEVIWYRNIATGATSICTTLSTGKLKKSDHHGRLRRDSLVARGREGAAAVLPRRRARNRTRPLFRSPVSCGLRWQRTDFADAGGRQS